MITDVDQKSLGLCMTLKNVTGLFIFVVIQLIYEESTTVETFRFINKISFVRIMRNWECFLIDSEPLTTTTQEHSDATPTHNTSMADSSENTPGKCNKIFVWSSYFYIGWYNTYGGAEN